MQGIDQTEADVLLPTMAEGAEPEAGVPADSIGSAEYRESLRRHFLARRTVRERLVDALRRVWYGPDPAPLTGEEMAMIMRPREDEDALPELVPPDDPERLAWEAELRAMGVRPATKWNFPQRPPRRKPGLLDRIKYRISLGW